MDGFGVCEPRVVTVISCLLKASYFIHRDFTAIAYSTTVEHDSNLSLLLSDTLCDVECTTLAYSS